MIYKEAVPIKEPPLSVFGLFLEKQPKNGKRPAASLGALKLAAGRFLARVSRLVPMGAWSLQTPFRKYYRFIAPGESGDSPHALSRVFKLAPA
ncbi:hypothetical protein [Rufibacter quisquiliarum]|uniref:Uncharacterized protein n=1 Tax=Rufibacter quisquiliarum TaxID=1549639 RepID=A0A839GUH9_9BACT|nr:hypothetical protein [Rufibacter quisquiliarum]MBA9078537.1 hypothetical protein [Rufibacter quisquiliarum]